MAVYKDAVWSITYLGRFSSVSLELDLCAGYAAYCLKIKSNPRAVIYTTTMCLTQYGGVVYSP